MKLYVIAGEASGDLHGANLMKALKYQNSEVDFKFWGGDLMSEVAGVPSKHIRDLAFMGFVEVIMNLRTILKNIKFCKEDILAYKPDALVLIDYPGFNLRIAEWAKENGIKVFYYISPQVWAWKQNRVHKIKRFVDKMFVILPFEKDFYKKFDFDVEYVGHPLLDAIEQYKVENNSAHFRSKNNLSNKPIIALLPGSRKQEIKKKLPIMLEAIKNKDDYQFLIAGAPSLNKDFYEQFLTNESIQLIQNKTYDLLNNSEAALVTSGTATLETALFRIPQVVCYKGSYLSYHIAKRLIKIDYISLVNLIMDREVVKELIQDDCNPKLVAEELEQIIEKGSKRKAMLSDYDSLIKNLGGGGASEKVAQSLLKTLSDWQNG